MTETEKTGLGGPQLELYENQKARVTKAVPLWLFRGISGECQRRQVSAHSQPFFAIR
jgi:hypothetical protein